jgi:hypothetical protein
MQPYDEALVYLTNSKVAATYKAAGADLDAQYPIWIARTVYDYCAGMLWRTSEAKHLQELRETLGLDVPPTPPVYAGRHGRVRLDGRAMVDDDGAWLPVGLSFFWPVREAGSDHVQRNLRWSRERGADFWRVFCEVQDWQAPYSFGPRDAGWLDRVRLVRDAILSVEARAAWTLFGGNALTPAEQMRLVEDVLVVCQEKPHAVQYVEISNEGQGFKDADGPRRMRSFAEIFARHGYPTALTSAAHGDDVLYPGSAATVATEHFERTPSEDGWRPVRQPWGYWDRQAMPPAFINNEPIGPGASGGDLQDPTWVQASTDPLRLACAAGVTWIAGGCAHVLHPAAGIYPKAEAQVNYSEHAALDPALAGVAALRRLLPADLPNWARQNHHWQGHPFSFAPYTPGDESLAHSLGCVRAFAATRGADSVCLPIGVMGDTTRGYMTLTPKQAMTWTTYDPLTGARLLTGNGPLTLTREVLIVGHLD